MAARNEDFVEVRGGVVDHYGREARLELDSRLKLLGINGWV